MTPGASDRPIDDWSDRGAAVELVGVGRTFSPYGLEPVVALDDVSITFPPGETTIVMGPSGSGKTTLLNVASGLDRPTAGSVTALGRELGGLGDAELTSWRRGNVAPIFQAKGLVAHLTAAENVELALQLAGVARGERRDRTGAGLGAVGLAAFAEHLPGELSGGQQQRVAIARALVSSAPLIVADEPTGELDTETAAEMVELIVAHVHRIGATALVATHDALFRDRVDRVVELVDGRIVSEASS